MLSRHSGHSVNSCRSEQSLHTHRCRHGSSNTPRSFSCFRRGERNGSKLELNGCIPYYSKPIFSWGRRAWRSGLVIGVSDLRRGAIDFLPRVGFIMSVRGTTGSSTSVLYKARQILECRGNRTNSSPERLVHCFVCRCVSTKLCAASRDDREVKNTT